MTTLSEEFCMTVGDRAKPKTACFCKQIDRGFDLAELLFDHCVHCGCEIYNKMSTAGHGAFAVLKVRQNNEKISAKMQNMEQERVFNNPDNMEPSPMKYSSKLMNSIWGMYNRYSVHNFKKNIDGSSYCEAGAANLQMQSAGYAAPAEKSPQQDNNKAAKTHPQLLSGFWAPSDYSY